MDEQESASVVECERCGRKNRVRPVGDGTPRCGRCHAPLPWIANADDDSFSSVVEASKIPVVVDMWAPWCAPCRMVTPALEQIARDMAGRVKLVKVDVDKALRTAERFAVRAVPLLLVMDEGEVIATHAGAAPAATLRGWVEEALARTSTPTR